MSQTVCGNGTVTGGGSGTVGGCGAGTVCTCGNGNGNGITASGTGIGSGRGIGNGSDGTAGMEKMVAGISCGNGCGSGLNGTGSGAGGGAGNGSVRGGTVPVSGWAGASVDWVGLLAVLAGRGPSVGGAVGDSDTGGCILSGINGSTRIPSPTINAMVLRIAMIGKKIGCNSFFGLRCSAMGETFRWGCPSMVSHCRRGIQYEKLLREQVRWSRAEYVNDNLRDSCSGLIPNSPDLSVDTYGIGGVDSYSVSCFEFVHDSIMSGFFDDVKYGLKTSDDVGFLVPGFLSVVGVVLRD